MTAGLPITLGYEMCSEISYDLIKPMEMISKQANNFWKDCAKHYFFTKLSKNTLE